MSAVFNDFQPSGAKPGGYEVDKNTGLTEREYNFVREFVISGGKKEKSAIKAGYAEDGARTRAYELMNKPRVIKEVARYRRSLYQMDATVARGVINELMMDDAVSDSVKANLAVAMLDRAGDKSPEVLEIIDKRSPKEIQDKLALLLGTDDIQDAIEPESHEGGDNLKHLSS